MYKFKKNIIFLIVLIILIFIFGIFIFNRDRGRNILSTTTTYNPKIPIYVDEKTIEKLSNSLTPIIDNSINKKYKYTILPDFNNLLKTNYNRIASCFIKKFINNGINVEQIDLIKTIDNFENICARVFLQDNNLLFCYNDKQISAIDAIIQNIDQNNLDINVIIEYIKNNIKDDNNFINSDYIDPNTNKMTNMYIYGYDFTNDENKLLTNFINSIKFSDKISDAIFYALQKNYLNIITKNQPVENKDLYNNFNKNFKYVSNCTTEKIINKNNIKNYSFNKSNGEKDYQENFDLTNKIINDIMTNGISSEYIKDVNICKEIQLTAINRILEKLNFESIDIKKLLLYVYNNFNFGAYTEFSEDENKKINDFNN